MTATMLALLRGLYHRPAVVGNILLQALIRRGLARKEGNHIVITERGVETLKRIHDLP